MCTLSKTDICKNVNFSKKCFVLICLKNSKLKKISVCNISSLNKLNCGKFSKYQKNPNTFCENLVTLVKHVKVKPICGKLICVRHNLQKTQSSIFIDMLTVQMSWIN